jgi:UDP-N-acetylglucosamine--N-acetylmuramyl-(pentapeptide) pyrophosphoryl-undecaprenol N-acetylglucosamine transferase
MKRVLLAGGGTGGHIYPLLAVAEQFKKDYSNDIELHYVGDPGVFASEFISRGIIVHKVMSGKIRRYFSLLNLIDIPKTLIGLLQSFFVVYWLMPDVLFSKGGPGSVAAVVAAWFHRVPVLIHESDAVPGLSNLLSAKFAKKIAVSFESASKYFIPPKLVRSGNPIRPGLLAQKMDTASAKETLGFSSETPLVLVLGGSQGSQKMNQYVVEILKQLIPQTQILHQTGLQNFADVKKMAEVAFLDIDVKLEIKNRYQPMAYLDGVTMARALSAADLVIARAGSGTIFEIATFAKPSILIPLPSAANDHQRENAYAYSSTGAGIVVEEANFSASIFASQIIKFVTNPDLMAKAGENALKFAKPEAAKILTEEIIKLT